MSHGGLLTGDLHGKLGSVVSFNKHGLRIQRGHKGWKNSKGSDVQWDRWLRLSICSKVWRWLIAHELTQLKLNEFISLNIEIAPYLTYEEYLATECPSAPWKLAYPNPFFNIEIIDVYIGRVTDWYFPDGIFYYFSVGVNQTALINTKGMPPLGYGIEDGIWERNGVNSSSTTYPPLSQILYSEQQATVSVENLLSLSWLKNISGRKWAVVCQNNNTPYPSLVILYETIVSYDSLSKLDPRQTLTEVKVDIQTVGKSLYRLTLETSYGGVRDDYSGGQYDYAKLPTRYSGALTKDWVALRRGETLPEPITFAKLLVDWDREKVISLGARTIYNETSSILSNENKGYLKLPFYFVEAYEAHNFHYFKDVMLTIGGGASTAYFSETSEYINRRTQAARERAINSWRSHRREN